MAGLQRSVETFRRSGSSGLVWQDRFISGDQNQMKNSNGEDTEFRELRQSQSVRPMGYLERNRSNGGGNAYRSGKVAPAVDPPSPKVSGCGFCGIFGKPTPAKSSNPRKR